jgi:hypothetical protein
MDQNVKERTIPPDEFRYRVLLARTHAGLTTREAADLCGTTSASWSNWERGMKPRDLLDVVERISEGLGVDRDWLMWGGPLSTPGRRDPLARRVLSRGSPTGSYGVTLPRPTCVPEQSTRHSPVSATPTVSHNGVTHRTGRVVRPVS